MKSQSVILKKGKEVIFKNRHLWIFSGAIAAYPDHFENGSIQSVLSSTGELLGHAYFNKDISIAGRIVSFGSIDPYHFIKENIQEAIAMRSQFFDEKQTNAYRLINGEADALPGLIVDKYNDCLVLQSFTLGMDRLKEYVVDCLIKTGKYNSIFEKSTSSSRREESLKEHIAILHGSNCPVIDIIEHGLKFKIEWEKGQKTGFFLDQREMRAKVRDLSHNRAVLNCFSYTGGFSVYALAGGAKSVDSIDISASAVDMAKANLELNGFDSISNPCISEDVFNFLTHKALPYDFVILDPPAFAKKKRDIDQAINGYRRINILALSKMPKRSLLLTCSCSYYIDEQMFKELLFQAAREAKRNVSIISKHIHGIDHPVNIFHPESDYLKSFLLYVN